MPWDGGFFIVSVSSPFSSVAPAQIAAMFAVHYYGDHAQTAALAADPAPLHSEATAAFPLVDYSKSSFPSPLLALC